jgi:hypothetical protein
MKFYWDNNPQECASLNELKSYADNNRNKIHNVPQRLAILREWWGAFAYYPDGRAVAYWLDARAERRSISRKNLAEVLSKDR